MTDTASPLRLDPDQLNAFLARAFPMANPDLMARVREVEPGRVLMSQAFDARGLRPGNLISGPTLMSMADVAAYALVLAHIGEVAMAVTTSLTIHFLRGAKPGELFAEGRLLKLGRRIATIDIDMWTESRDRLAARATVAYAIPG